MKCLAKKFSFLPRICTMTGSAPSWYVLRARAYTKEVSMDVAECSWHFGVTLTSSWHFHQENLLGPMCTKRLSSMQGVHTDLHALLHLRQRAVQAMLLEPSQAAGSQKWQSWIFCYVRWVMQAFGKAVETTSHDGSMTNKYRKCTVWRVQGQLGSVSIHEYTCMLYGIHQGLWWAWLYSLCE